MLRRRIGGAAGPEVSALCLGTLAFGSTVDEETSFAILNRFTEAGGNLIDTSNHYVARRDGRTGDESETTVGRWLASRRVREDVLIATKVGGRPAVRRSGPAAAEGLSAPVITKAAQESLRRLGTDRIDLYWTQAEDRTVPLEETLCALNILVQEGTVGLVGAANHSPWRIDRARTIALRHGWAGYTCVQQRYSYLQPRFDIPLPEAGHVHATSDLLDYVRSEPDVTLLAYATLLSGAYTRRDKPLPAAYCHPGTEARLAALRAVAGELGATLNQVVLAWLTGGSPPVLPVVGVSSVAQLDEVIEGFACELTPAQRERLDRAG